MHSTPLFIRGNLAGFKNWYEGTLDNYRYIVIITIKNTIYRIYEEKGKNEHVW